MVSNNTWPAGYCWNSETRGGGELGVGGLGGGERGDDELGGDELGSGGRIGGGFGSGGVGGCVLMMVETGNGQLSQLAGMAMVLGRRD